MPLLDTPENDMIEFKGKHSRSRTFDTADAKWISHVIGSKIKVRPWKSFIKDLDEAIMPPLDFENTFMTKLSEINKDSKRKFGTDVVRIFTSTICKLPEFHRRLSHDKSKLTSTVSVDDRRFKLSGVIDTGVSYFGTPLTTNLMGAKNMDDIDLWRCIAGTTALFHNLRNEDIDMKGAWGVLTNGSEWRFITIYGDEELLKVWCSETIIFDPFVYDHDKTCFIYRALYYIVHSSYVASEDYEECNRSDKSYGFYLEDMMDDTDYNYN